MSSVDDLKTALADYEDILTFEEVGNYIKVQLKQFLHGDQGKAKWEAINNQVKEFGGKWVSLGKDSHWQVSKKVESPKMPQLDKDGLVLEAIDLMEKALTKLREAGY